MQRAENLQYNGGRHFFDETKKEIFPQEDFWLCIKCNQFPFVIQIKRDEQGYVTKRIDVL